MSSKSEYSAATQIPAFIVKAGKDRIGGTLHVFSAEVSVKISTHDSSGAYAVMEVCTPPNGGPPLHLHHREDEWWYILDGNIVIEVNGNTLSAGPGDTVFAPRGSRHTFQNIGTVPARTVLTVVPGGFDMFFQEVSAAVPPGTAPDPAVILPISQKYGLEFLGPPLNKR
jgi:mannose-6-phosphate isomerase-like protein (cupin superfamily)